MYLQLWDGNAIHKLVPMASSNGFSNPSLSNGRLVWSDWDGEDREIYLYDGGAVVQITDNDRDDLDPALHGDWLVYTHVPPKCDDGYDNDGDGLVDWDGGGVGGPDFGCMRNPNRDREQNNPYHCGLGPELLVEDRSFKRGSASDKGMT